MCVHIFGDVPSPVITGLLKDFLAPNCSPPLSPNVSPSSLNITDNVILHLPGSLSSIFSQSLPLSISLEEYKGAANSIECRADGHGLRLTMLIVSLWLFMSALWFAFAFYLSSTMNTDATADSEVRDIKHLHIVNIVNLDIKGKKSKEGKSFKSKRAQNRLHLQEPLLNLDEDNL